MRRLHIPRGLPLALLLTLTASLLSQSLPPGPPSVTAPAPVSLSLPITFEPNAGQTDRLVRFLAHAPGGTFLFTPDQIVLALDPTGCAGADCAQAVDHIPRCATRGVQEAAPPPPGLVRLRWVDGLPTVALQGSVPLPGRAAYFTGNDPARWRAGLPTYAALSYLGLYPGIDLQFGGTGSRLKGTYTVAAGADPARIRWRYEGAADLRIDAAGDLQYRAGEAGTLVTEQAPTAWQERAGERVPVPVRYRLDDEGAGFALGSYDPAQPLIIDPTIIYGTTVGGSGDDDGWAITLDRAGNTYVTGSTTSSDFPAANGYQPGYGGGFSDVFVIKLDAAGTVVYATYLGGGGEDLGLGISVDEAGNIYLAGSTGSTDFPLAQAVQPQYGGGNVDAFVTELNAAGTALIYSTYLGGNYDDCTVGIATDGAGNLVTAGYTASTDFPVVNALQPHNAGSWDAFVTGLGTAGATLRYSTYLGGSDYELVSGFVVDPAGNAYLTGETGSSDFPTHNAVQPANAGDDDVFVSKLSADGKTLIYSTYLGGSEEDENWGIALDGGRNAYISGTTESPDFPTRNALQPQYGGDGDAFLTKLNATGTALVYATYLGGDKADAGLGVAVDGTGSAILGGTTASATFPLVAALQPKFGGGLDAFVARFDPTGTRLLYSTFLGGSGTEEGRGLVADAAGNVYLTGYTTSSDFPFAAPSHSATGQGHNVFVVGLNPRAPDAPTGPGMIGK
jgi:hypothetical protein